MNHWVRDAEGLLGKEDKKSFHVVALEQNKSKNRAEKALFSVLFFACSIDEIRTLSLPEAPETRNPFLIQLAWTAQLGNSEIEMLLDRYEREVKSQIVIEQEKMKAGFFSPDRTPRETAIWGLLYENILKRHEGELEWVHKVRQTLQHFDSAEYETYADGAAVTEREEK